MLRRPFRLFTLLRFFKFNCFRLLWVVQVANEVFLGVTKFSLFLLLYDAFKVVSKVFGLFKFKLFQFVFNCHVLFRMFYVVFGCLVCFSVLLCSGLYSVVFGRLNSVSCLRCVPCSFCCFLFSLFTSFQVVVGNLCCFRSFRLFYTFFADWFELLWMF